MPGLTLAKRAFLLSFLPICLVLAACFLGFSAAIHQRIRQELRESLQENDRLLNRANAEYARKTSKLIANLTESAGLKAAVGLLAESRADASSATEVRRTIETQLADLQSSSAYDLLAVSDSRGQTVAVVMKQASGANLLPVVPEASGLQEIAGELYQLQSVPIEIGGESVATLALGTRFELNDADSHAVLLRDGQLVRSSFPAFWKSKIEQQVHEKCEQAATGCEVSINRETFVVSQLEKAQVGGHYRLLGLRSLDARLREFNDAFERIVAIAGVGGVLLALLCTGVTSYSVSRPLRYLVAQLRASEVAGRLPERLTAGSGVTELDSLANAFNRVAEAEKRTRRDLETAKTAAETANRLKTEFLTNVSHELRTPLNGALGMTELLLASSLNEEQRDFAGIVKQCSESLLALINEILDFSSLEMGTLKLETGPFDVREILADVKRELLRRTAGNDVGVETFVDDSVPELAVGDGRRIRQVLMHFADNAAKFTEKGCIRVTIERLRRTGSNSRLKFSVEDTGIGIPESMQGLLFEKFCQGDGSLTRRKGGTGLGLGMAKELVTLMGGDIGFESKPGVGSAFWFELALPLTGPNNEDTANVHSASTQVLQLPC